MREAKMNLEKRGESRELMTEGEVDGSIDDSLFDRLYKVTMENKWDQVLKIYQENLNAHKTKLTKSKETALHIAISSYNSKKPWLHEECIKRMIHLMEEEGSLRDVLAMQNERGDTPLHLAAAVGWLEFFQVINGVVLTTLLDIQNDKGETPIYVAALHGNLQAFTLLHDEFNPRESLPARSKDGSTILHKAISGEYFELAYKIIGCYPKLVNYINEDGESPLHVLARKPNAFKSSSHLRFYDSIIYFCVFVEKLSDGTYDSTARSNRFSLETNSNHPKNYTTCVNIFALLRSLTLFIPVLFPIHKKQPSRATDVEENPHHQENKPQPKREKGYRGYHDLFPGNYVTCVELFKCAMKVILIVLGVGFWRIRKIEEKKTRYLHAMEVMEAMIKLESTYKYDNDGQRPPNLSEPGSIEIPHVPPHEFDHDGNHHTTTSSAATSSTTAPLCRNENANVNENDQNKPGGKVPEADGFIPKDTPLLVAARMGILEMVKSIHKKCPVAIRELDSKEKNVIMLAAEHRHSAVFDYLLNETLPEYMFHQLDKEDNSILHLAAKLSEPELQPWRIPGAALQMQWEIKWCKHVKGSLPSLSGSHPNKHGKTPRTIFSETHKDLKKAGSDWLIKTSESCSVVAALIAAVAFATSSTVPGGLEQNDGVPVRQDEKAFDVFSIASLVALCLSVTALVFFLGIITSRCEERDFKRSLPRKLLVGLSSLFASIAAILLSFCSGHTFILRKELRVAAIPIYASATLPVAFYAIAQLPLYFDLLWATYVKVPLRSYKVFCH